MVVVAALAEAVAWVAAQLVAVAELVVAESAAVARWAEAASAPETVRGSGSVRGWAKRTATAKAGLCTIRSGRMALPMTCRRAANPG